MQVKRIDKWLNGSELSDGLTKKIIFARLFPHSQCSVVEPGPTPSPWSIYGSNLDIQIIMMEEDEEQIFDMVEFRKKQNETLRQEKWKNIEERIEKQMNK